MCIHKIPVNVEVSNLVSSRLSKADRLVLLLVQISLNNIDVPDPDGVGLPGHPAPPGFDNYPHADLLNSIGAGGGGGGGGGGTGSTGTSNAMNELSLRPDGETERRTDGVPH